MPTDFTTIALHTDTEEPVLMRSAWAKGPAVMVWLRHWG